MSGSWLNYSGKGLPSDVRWLSEALPGAPSRDRGAAAMRRLIAVKSMRGIELVPVLDVRCFLAHQKYVTAIHGKGETIITESLRDLEAEFAGGFLRVHRSALVGIEFIEGMERCGHRRHQLRLAGVSWPIPVSRRYAPLVRRRLTDPGGLKGFRDEFRQPSLHDPRPVNRTLAPVPVEARLNHPTRRKAVSG